jgi:hypothetical protein
MQVAPIKSASVVRDMMLGRRPAKRATIGDPTTSVPYDEGPYGGASPIPVQYALRADFLQILVNAGYLEPGMAPEDDKTAARRAR